MSEVLTPKSIETKSGVNAKGKPWTLYRVEFTDGTRASTFDATTAKFIEANYGKPVNVEISVTEKGKDLISAWPIDGAAPAPKPARVQVQNTSKDDFMRPRNPAEGRVIAKQACLKAAVEYDAAFIAQDRERKADPQRVLECADIFVEWVFKEETGVRHLPGKPANATVEAHAAAVTGDKPAGQLLKDTVVGLIPTATADAKAVLRSYGLSNVADVQARLTEYAAKQFMEANDPLPF